MDAIYSVQQALLRLDSGGAALTTIELLKGAPNRHILMSPLLPPLIIILYLLSLPALWNVCKTLETTGKSTIFRSFVFLHNLALCVFSVWTSASVLPIVIPHILNHGLQHALCEHSLWNSGIGYFSFLFYLSKFWELLDSLLLIVKRRRPSFLQVYHHAVTILCAYMIQASHAKSTIIFVTLNALVHSGMYAYYALSVLGIRLPVRRIITTIQLAQFLTGIALATPTFWFRGGMCATEGEKFALSAFLLHAVFLTALFLRFYSLTYGRKEKKV